MSKPSSLSLSAIKAATSSRSRIEDDQKAFECDALVLILSHLQSRGFLETATCLLRESMSLKLYEQADNLDLTKILKEYEAFYEMRYGRRPIFSRPVQDKYGNPDDAHGNQKHDTRSKRKQPPTKQHRNRNSALPPLNPSQEPSRKRSFREESAEEEKCDDLGVDEGVTGFAVNSPTKSKMNHAKSNGTHKTTSLKPLPNFGGDIELRSLALTIRQDIIQTSPGIKWNDIVELDDVKRIMKEAIILPRQFPELFTGLRAPWRSVLLHGPPGVGKTLLAKAVATESNTVFFNISASSIVSKYRGDSEKLVRVLFELASYYAPSTIFFDEVDSIIGHRSGTHGSLAEGEHEGSRRMKTELLVQMDGLVASNKDVFVLAASNLPWDLDSAFLRRLEKRVFIPLPEKQGRKEMIRSHLSEFPLAPTFHKDGLFDLFADQTDGFSGSDIKTLCKEVSMRPLRRMLTQLEHKAGSVVDMSLLIKKHPITVDDFRESLSAINQSTDAELCRRHKIWSETHGSR